MELNVIMEETCKIIQSEFDEILKQSVGEQIIEIFKGMKTNSFNIPYEIRGGGV